MTEQEYKEFIYKKAEEVNSEEALLVLIKEIKEFDHDYGTIVYGCMAAMIAAFKVINNSPAGGITGFQAGCLGWECIHKFMIIEAPCKIVNYNNMLFPQYAYEFEKTITSETWFALRTRAKEKLNKNQEYYHPDVLAHLTKVAEGVIPFGYEIKD